MNKLANTSDLTTIKKYVKNIQNINPDVIKSPHLVKFKSYLKIVGLSYIMEQGIITPNIIKDILKELYLFKDVTLASKLYIIKVSPKSNIAVVWIDIWDFQSSSTAKNIVNY